MATIITRAGKGSPLENAEVDANFTNLNTDKLEKSGGTMTGDLTFGDNDKAIFGAGNDLEIYHDGSHTSIKENNAAGNLYLQANNAIALTNNARTENFAQFFENGESNLWYDGSKKLATTSTGIDVTGTVTADGLTVNTSNPEIEITNTAQRSYSFNVSGTSFYLKDKSDAQNIIKVDEGGDISFYEGTGTTPKFFWDASAESLGIGTSSPERDLHVKGKSGDPVHFKLEGDPADYARIMFDDGTTDNIGELRYNFGSDYMSFNTNSSERMRIDSSGNVGIGTSSPTERLTIAGNMEFSNQGSKIVFQAGNTSSNTIRAEDGDGYASAQIEFLGTGSSQSHAITFSTGSSPGSEVMPERMRIDSSGNVGIGISSPGANLDVFGLLSNPAEIRITNNGGTWDPEDEIGRYSFYTTDTSSTGARELASVRAINDNQASATVSMSGALAFYTSSYNSNVSERMRIDSSGNLLVGTTTAITQSGTTTGSRFSSTGIAWHIADNAPSLFLGRTSTDGTIIDFRKDGTTVGSIGTLSDSMYFGNAKSSAYANLRYTNDQVHPCTSAGADNDNTINLGKTSSRFKNLYLSGGVYLGGTGAANYLDDYEEGTFTPSFIGGTMSVSYAEQLGRYTKVGNLVHITVTIFTTDVTITAGGVLNISGLPFTPLATGNQETIALSIGRMRRWTVNRTCNTVAAVAVNNNSSLQLYATPTANINETYLQTTDLKTGAYSYGNGIDIAGTYITA